MASSNNKEVPEYITQRGRNIKKRLNLSVGLTPKPKKSKMSETAEIAKLRSIIQRQESDLENAELLEKENQKQSDQINTLRIKLETARKQNEKSAIEVQNLRIQTEKAMNEIKEFQQIRTEYEKIL